MKRIPSSFEEKQSAISRTSPPLHLLREYDSAGAPPGSAPLPERAVMDENPVACHDLQVGAADIDPDHSRSTWPWLSKRTLPDRCTASGPSPLDAAMRRSAISSSMQATIPTRLVVMRGLTSTMYGRSARTISIPQYPWQPSTFRLFCGPDYLIEPGVMLSGSLLQASRTCHAIHPDMLAVQSKGEGGFSR